MPDPFDASAVQAAYDATAEDYTEAFADDLLRLPTDREVLDSLAERVNRELPVLDLGCGPGQVGQYLAERGLRVVGLDLALQMLLEARRRTGNPSLVHGDMRSAPFASGSFSGVVAFYSIHHLRRSALETALAEVRRILKPTGLFVVATHLGESEVYSSEFLGHQIATVGGTLYKKDELLDELHSQSFVVEDVRLRDPLPHEHQSGRIYVTSCSSAS
jgi:ubiquinone/menaquinone biosynthesis C-methylase UbiE